MKELKSVANVIELKPNKKYLLVFSGEEPVTMDDMDRLIMRLKKEGITGVGLALGKGQRLEVIEREEGKI